MQNQRALITAAIAGLLAMGSTTVVDTANAAEKEKCWGIAKAGQNACDTNRSKHTCAGHAKVDNDPYDFIEVPKGSCLRVGGSLARGGDVNTSGG